MIIREETHADIDAIFDITRAAFKGDPHSNQTEPFIFNALRAAGALSVSLVAEIEGRVVGYIAFSPVTISGNSTDWYGMGPISVLPVFQNQGIGSRLVNEGLGRLKTNGGKGCILVGDPKIYGKFGFLNIASLIYDGIHQVFFLVLPFEEKTSGGVVTFHEGFGTNGR